jgi:hypothetical protein
MPGELAPAPQSHLNLRLVPMGRWPGIRVLAWSGNELYGSRGYALLRGLVRGGQVQWENIAHFNPQLWRRISSKSRLASRLVRDGFHALTTLPSGQLIGALPGAIVTLKAGEREFRTTHKIVRGTRPLHLISTPDGRVLFGEYFDNPARDEVHIYSSSDGGNTWDVAYTFPKRAIRHIHNIAYDRWADCLWILTGDNGSECRILRASRDLKTIDAMISGNQQARAVALVIREEGLYFASDTPLERNYVYHLDRTGSLMSLCPLDSSSIHGCQVGDAIFFTTMVEPSDVNRSRKVQLYGSRPGEPWRALSAWEKDALPMRFFQYGNAFLPDGSNTTNCLALTTQAVKAEDSVAMMFQVQ